MKLINKLIILNSIIIISFIFTGLFSLNSAKKNNKLIERELTNLANELKTNNSNKQKIINLENTATIINQNKVSLAKTILGLFLITIVVAIGIVYYQIRIVFQPVAKLQNAARRITQGDFDTEITIISNDEFGELSAILNQMMFQLKQLIEEQTVKSQSQNQDRVAELNFIEQQKKENEALQHELLQFISSIEEASNGNLTVRASITDGSIGIVADFFNSIIESIREIVAQVKVASTQVNSSISNNEIAIEEVAQETLQQTEQISQALNRVEEMTRSIQEVAHNAQQAALVSRTASATAEIGGQAIEETVNSILQLRETIASTAKKVKRLGESSQEISKVVSLIDRIAMQTNLLAINASIEASRAGEEGRGFAVVAEEVGELATKSSEATREIEEIVENIQEETQEVVAAMEIGTSQVVEGTRLVQNTKESLDRIAEVSQQIDRLLQSISSTTISQAQTSQTVTKLMEEVASVSQKTSHASLSVSESLEKTVKIAQQLEASVDTFTV